MASSASVKKIVGDLAESRTHHDQHTVSELHKPQKMVNNEQSTGYATSAYEI